MEGIHHRTVAVNGISMHVAEIGEGPVVLFVHGFPELWYSWRHQMVSLAARGYRAVAPDMRGYGDTDAPSSPECYTVFHVVGDLIALIDVLGQEQVFVVGHDWGALIAWQLCLFRPDRVKAVVNLSVAYRPRIPMKPMDNYRSLYGDDFYMCRFQEPGEMEAEFGSIGTATLMKTLLTSGIPGPFMLPKGKSLEILADAHTPLPSWLSEDDINYYAEKFDKTGFTGALNYYRSIDLSWELRAPWTEAQVKVPVKFIVGDLDLTYNCWGGKEYINNGDFKKDVPSLEDVVVMEGVGHFVHQERADEVSDHIYEFIQKF